MVSEIEAFKLAIDFGVFILTFIGVVIAILTLFLNNKK